MNCSNCVANAIFDVIFGFKPLLERDIYAKN